MIRLPDEGTIFDDKIIGNGYWLCDKNHSFNKGDFRTPRNCPTCNSTLFRWIPGGSS